MQDNEIIYELKLTEKETEFVEQARKEYMEMLSKMTKKELLQYFRDNYCLENNLNFEKEINGTVYQVNTFFNEDSVESILQKFLRLTKDL